MSYIKNKDRNKVNISGHLRKSSNMKDENNSGNRHLVNLRSFCQNTSLHGFHYMTSTETNTIERVIWSVVCLIFLILAIAMMVKLMCRFHQTPTTTTIETTAHPIWDFYFPAITICNHNKIYLPAANRLSKRMIKNGFKQEDIDRVFDLLPQLIRPAVGNGRLKDAPDILKSFNMTTEALMLELMPPCDKLLRNCIWLDNEYDCNKIFKPSKSSEGFCCSFNYHLFDDSSKKDLDLSVTEINDLPGVIKAEQVPGAGQDFGLIVNFDLESQFYRGSISSYVGASIMVHNPHEYPEVDLRSVIIQPSQEVTILLSGTVIESENTVQNLPVDLRNCLFEDERKLKISSTYRYQSCVSQCRIKFIANHCNCIPFYYPHIYNKRWCGLEDINCLLSIRKNISELQTASDVKAYIDNAEDVEDLSVSPEDFIPDCKNCFPLCSDSWYTLNTESAFMELFDNNLRRLKYQTRF